MSAQRRAIAAEVDAMQLGSVLRPRTWPGSLGYPGRLAGTGIDGRPSGVFSA
jgi:hypothetical protein